MWNLSSLLHKCNRSSSMLSDPINHHWQKEFRGHVDKESHDLPLDRRKYK